MKINGMLNGHILSGGNCDSSQHRKQQHFAEHTWMDGRLAVLSLILAFPV